MRRRCSHRGQALVELSLVLPMLLVLLVGAAQVGVISYGNVTMDTAAREGARMASERPKNATNFSGPNATYVGCTTTDKNANYVVQSVCNNAGILDTSQITVKITKNVDVTALVLPSSSIRLVASCSNGWKTLTGTISGIPSGQSAVITTTADGTVSVSVPSSNPSYSVCLPKGTQTVSANVGTGCTGWSASTSLNPQFTTTWSPTLQPNPTCVALVTTTTALSANPTSTTSGQTVTFTATVSVASGGPATGPVTFVDTIGGGTTTLGSASLNGSGTAQFQTNALSTGTHSVTANYGGDTTYGSSASSPVTVTVASAGLPTTTSTVTASPSSAQVGQSITLSSTVTSLIVTPTDTVTFSDTFGGSTVALGTATLSAGAASLSTSALAVGTHSIAVTYGGDTGHSSSSSASITVTVTPSSGGGPPGPSPYTCPDGYPLDGLGTPLTTWYLQVDVTYPVPIFVPFVGALFANAAGSRIVTITQVIRIEPCSITQGH